ncbi:hypothetical protein Taro_036345 [Colocasia esculenta]|uniref:Uncharacterized protein n=1 Tax=Colocasia esculenta TaxID=4460 RepID=A0A843WLE2_COLES|nr:hypothetical protein [Colocasia esculenta]
MHDKVWLFNSRLRGNLKSRWDGPYTVVKACDNGAIIILDQKIGYSFTVIGQRLIRTDKRRKVNQRRLFSTLRTLILLPPFLPNDLGAKPALASSMAKGVALRTYHRLPFIQDVQQFNGAVGIHDRNLRRKSCRDVHQHTNSSEV